MYMPSRPSTALGHIKQRINETKSIEEEHPNKPGKLEKCL